MNTNEAATPHLIWLAEQYQCAVWAGSRSRSSPFLLLFFSFSPPPPPQVSHQPPPLLMCSRVPVTCRRASESSLKRVLTHADAPPPRKSRAVRVRGGCSRESCRKSIFIHAHASTNMCKSFIIPGFSLFSSLSPRRNKSARPPCSGSGELSGGRRERGRRRRAERRPGQRRRGGGQTPRLTPWSAIDGRRTITMIYYYYYWKMVFHLFHLVIVFPNI